MTRHWFRSKHIIRAFIFAMMVYVLVHTERFVINANDPMWKHYEPFRWWLLVHVVAGGSALLLGPLQFSDRLRRRYLNLHRVLGRIYVAGVLIGAPIGAFIQYWFDERVGTPRSFTIATVVDASLWLLTTGIGLAFALRGNIQQHRQWMTRSYAVAIVFLEVRVLSGLGGWDGNPAMAEMLIWICLAFSVLAADITIHGKDLLSSRSVRAKATQSVRSQRVTSTS